MRIAASTHATLALVALAAADCSARAPSSESAEPLASDISAHPPNRWFVTRKLNDHTYIISMPKYWQLNVAYLFIGRERAILFDTGPGVYSIKPVVEQITKLPVLAIPSHLHFDHIGKIDVFSQIGMLDRPDLRSVERDGKIVLRTNQLMLVSPNPPFAVSTWIADGQIFDLGGVKITAIGTPGHSPDSITLIDEAAGNAFVGDLLDSREIWALTEGAKLEQVGQSARKILGNASLGHFYAGHAEKPMSRDDLEKIARDIDMIAAGKVAATDACFGGADIKTYIMNGTKYRTGDLKPLADNVAVLRQDDHACRNNR